VHAIQDGFTIEAISGRAQGEFRADPSIDMKTPPLEQVLALSAQDFFALGRELTKLHPPRAAGQRLADDLGRIGVYGNAYLKRACVALAGLGANQPEDAVYPLNVADADGNPLDGGDDYVLQFDAAELPPVEAFWSVTMYDGEGFQVANALDRFAIGDRDELAYNPDGSLDLYLQHRHPGPEREPNWLPAPEGPLGVTMRLYAPKPEALDGRWNPPAIRKTAG
jgi:hypothetical protein